MIPTDPPHDPVRHVRVFVEVADLVEAHFRRHPGEIDLGSLPATRADAGDLLEFRANRCFLPLAAVPGDCETVRFVADLLHQLGRAAAQGHRRKDLDLHRTRGHHIKQIGRMRE